MYRSEGGKDLLRTVALPAAITLLMLAALVGAILQFSTSESNEFALARQRGLVAIAVEHSFEAIAKDQEASTYWDDAVLRTRERPLDLEWIDNNLGVWFHTYYGQDEAYLLDPADRPIYAMAGGRRTPPQSFDRVAGAALPLAKSLRKRLFRGRAGERDGAGQTPGSADLAVIGGRPAFVSLKPILSETGNIRQPARSEHVHVAVRYLDQSFLKSLSTRYLIDEPRFQWRASGPASLALRSSQGQVLGHLTWRPFQPGQLVKSEMVPVLFGALLVVGGLISLLLWRIQRSRIDLEASRAQAQHLAFHDSLTGLPNRALFERRLEHALRRRNARVAVLLLDLDRFKNVNDTMGHQAGDALICQFGHRLSAVTRDFDTISRLGGDEFAILVEDARQDDVHALAARILDDLRRPFDIFGSQVYVGVSIGISEASDAGTERTELMRQADIALYRAKDAGRNDYRLFTPDMDDHVMLRARLEEDLRGAVATGAGLSVHYQPQVAPDGTIVGIEALLRWHHPTRGDIAPEEFVPVAEESGLIGQLGEWVLVQACAVSARWPDLFVAINLSPIQFRASAFVDQLMAIVRDAGADPSRLQLEVTECVLLDDDETVKAVLTTLRSAGFTIVLDDFGTGYSSLSYLRKFEVDKIKIDRSFVEHLGDRDSGAIITAVLALGHAMGLAVAAEGVETVEQKTFLQIAGCKEMQGYYFAPAMPEGELEALLSGSRSSPRVA